MHRKYYYTAISWFVVVLILICMPGSTLPKTDNWMDKIFLDKWVHASMFGILAYLCMRPVIHGDGTVSAKMNFLWAIVVATSLWGLATEFIQKYCTTTRTFELLDWLADTIGALVAILFARIKHFKKA